MGYEEIAIYCPPQCGLYEYYRRLVRMLREIRRKMQVKASRIIGVRLFAPVRRPRCEDWG